MRKDFQSIKAKILADLLSIYSCPVDSRSRGKLDIAADILSYQNLIIPYPYSKFSISDFTGKVKGKSIIPSDIAIAAKQKLLDYCWQGIKLDDIIYHSDDIYNFLSKKSSIAMRKRKGHNVIIYSDPTLNRESSGKTFCAAIIMKEAISRRIEDELSGDTYKWIGYSQLKRMLIYDNLASVEYSQSDWLVVDDIDLETTSKKGQNYISSLLDPFFSERIQDLLPTILVFKFDVDKMKITDQDYGSAIFKIVKSENTTRIRLSA